MTISAKLQLLTCLIVYATSAHAIMVKFGTNDGPIPPLAPPPPPPPPQKPYRDPAPVWEPRSGDSPDPNANWRPQLFIPQPRYTEIIYNLNQHRPNSAKQFANSYLPRQPQPIRVQPTQDYLTPTQMVSQLSSQRLPGLGLRYFVPLYVDKAQQKTEKRRQEDAKLNEIETNQVYDREGDSERQWKAEKEGARRNVRQSAEGTVQQYVYQWPAYVPHRYQ